MCQTAFAWALRFIVLCVSCVFSLLLEAGVSAALDWGQQQIRALYRQQQINSSVSILFVRIWNLCVCVYAFVCFPLFLFLPSHTHTHTLQWHWGWWMLNVCSVKPAAAAQIIHCKITEASILALDPAQFPQTSVLVWAGTAKAFGLICLPSQWMWPRCIMPCLCILTTWW